MYKYKPKNSENQKNNFLAVRTGFEPALGLTTYDILFTTTPSSHLTVLEMVCGVDPLPLQPKGFTQKRLLELSSVSYLPKLLTTSFDAYPRRDSRI